MSKTLTDIYQYYKEKNTGTEKITEKLFREIWAVYIAEAIDIVLEGGYIILPGRLGELSVVRKERDPEKKAPNWGETNKLRKEGFEGIVYFTDPMYIRFLWRKSRCYVKNRSIWNFKPTRGAKGLKTKLKQKLDSDELAYLNFKKHGHI